MSSSEIDSLLSALFGDTSPVAKVQWSEAGRAACITCENGDVYGGNFGEPFDPNSLIEMAADGSLARYFQMYEPVEPEIVQEKLAEQSDWKEIYPVKG